MPHIRVELSGNLARPGRLKPLLVELAERLGEFETIDPASIKAYLNVREHFAMSPAGPPGFAHVEVSIMQGRDIDLRRRMAEAMRDIVAAEFAEKIGHHDIAITIEIREMEADTYLK